MSNLPAEFNFSDVSTNVQSSGRLQRAAENMASRSMNRISLKGREFRFQVDGQEYKHEHKTLEVIVIGAMDNVGRLYFGGNYDPNGENQSPVCWSNDGQAPASNVAVPQGVSCEQCPMNQAGSRIRDDGGKSKACGFLVRLIVLVPHLPADKNVFQLDVKSMSLFGDSDSENRMFSWTGYVQAMVTMQVPDYHWVMTNLSFTDDSVPALRFQPVRRTPNDWVSYATNLIKENASYEKQLSIAGGKLVDKTVQEGAAQPTTQQVGGIAAAPVGGIAAQAQAGIVDPNATAAHAVNAATVAQVTQYAPAAQAMVQPMTAYAPVAEAAPHTQQSAVGTVTNTVNQPAAPVAQAPAAPAPTTVTSPVAQAPVLGAAPVAQAPVAQAPVAQAPLAQAPVAQAPVAQAPVAPQMQVEVIPPNQQAPIDNTHASLTSDSELDNLLAQVAQAT